MELKDYLHFYLGCDVFIIDPKDGEPQIRKLMGVDNTWANPLRLQLGEYVSAFNYDEVKLILRPLSDMTEEEKLHIVTEITYNHVKFSSKESALHSFDNEMYSGKVIHARFYVDEVIYLCKQGFNLFDPEWKHCIDRTTLTINK